MDFFNVITINNLHVLAQQYGLQFLVNIKTDEVTFQINKFVNGAKKTAKHRLKGSEIDEFNVSTLATWITDVGLSIL
jgi:hypothetical protein